MSRRELAAMGIRPGRLAALLAAVWLPTAAAAGAVSTSSHVDGDTWLPAGVVGSILVGAVGLTFKITWSIATERKSVLGRIDRIEEELRRMRELLEDAGDEELADADDEEARRL